MHMIFMKGNGPTIHDLVWILLKENLSFILAIKKKHMHKLLFLLLNWIRNIFE